LYSVLFFSDDDVVRELVLILVEPRHHLFSLLDQGCLLGEDVELKELTYLFVGCRGLSNDEVQEDDASNQDDQNPNDPVNVVLSTFQLHSRIESEVTKGHSQGLNDVSDEETNNFVLNSRVPLISLVTTSLTFSISGWLAQLFAILGIVLVLERSRNLSVSKSDDSQ
jgi:hypothetical protein